jgi:hypothetical protein
VTRAFVFELELELELELALELELTVQDGLVEALRSPSAGSA